MHTSLTQYVRRLKSESLRCIHDARPTLAEELKLPEGSPTEAVRNATPATQAFAEISGEDRARRRLDGLYVSSGASSKISHCARDLVAQCRKCGAAVCRNCAAKTASNVKMKERLRRLRRLCRTCLDAPIQAHFQSHNQAEESNECPPASSASSIRSERSFSGSLASEWASRLDELNTRDAYAFTSPAFLRGPCICDSRGIYLCGPCGGNLRAGDTTYERVFTWRSRYSTHIGGGLGTGLGLGNQGQKCGRGESCLDTSSESVCWVEVDCSEDNNHDSPDHDGFSLSRARTPDSPNNKPGYLQQEVVSTPHCLLVRRSEMPKSIFGCEEKLICSRRALAEFSRKR